jgi:hypothetical protein
MMKRDDILRLDDAQLSACCKLEFYKDSGPGGQKRNKTSSAARVTLPGWEISATDCTERSQVRNRANALKKLRINLALTVRETPAVPPERLECSLTHADYPLYLAHLLDVFSENVWDFKAAAAVLGISPTAFVKKLYKDPVVWQMVLKELTARNLPLPKPPK